MEKETKAPEKLPWDGNEEFDKYLEKVKLEHHQQ